MMNESFIQNYLASPIWANSVDSKRLRLVRPQAGHAEVLFDWFSNAGFTADYNAFIGNPKSSADSYILRVKQPPQQLHQLDWIIEDFSGNALGLASLADIQLFHQRAEFLIGFPNPVNSRLIVEATALVLKIAFSHLAFEKIISLVYGNNAKAQRATLNLGFRNEGKLMAHLVSPVTLQREDLYMNAMLQHEFMDNQPLQKVINRLLGHFNH